LYLCESSLKYGDDRLLTGMKTGCIDASKVRWKPLKTYQTISADVELSTMTFGDAMAWMESFDYAVAA
jgi:hypothetical protein